MANFYATTRTNYFRVTNEVKYAELFDRLISGESELYDFSKTDEKGVIWHGFGAYDTIDAIVPDYETEDDDSEDDEDEDYYDEEEYDFDAFLKELSTILPDGEAFIMFSVGNEKLRYVCGDAVIVTNKGIESVNLKSAAIAKASEMLGMPFETSCEC